MTIWRLVRREIYHRKGNFVLGLLSVLIAAGVLSAQFTLLDAHTLRTERVLKEKEAEAEKRLAEMEDDYRKIMKELGFNLIILPEAQDLNDLWSQGYGSKTMPEEYVTRLSESNIVLIRHLLPIIEQRVYWSEQGRTINLVGTRGEVPFTRRAPKEPMLLTVPPGKIVMGHRLCSDLGLEIGDEVALLGKRFVVQECNSERATIDDITVWIDLKVAQEMLNKRGEINAIRALQCLCRGSDIENLRREIPKILPNTQVNILENLATVRAKARKRAKAEHMDAMESERAAFARLKREREAFLAWLAPVVVLGCAMLIGAVTFANVRERRSEIGILQALGVGAGKVFCIFTIKAALWGLIGSVLGYALGYMVGMVWSGGNWGSMADPLLFNPTLFASVVVVAPILSCFASWAPAMIAVLQDPAEVLRDK